jgi:3-hydroxyisobutyrate dehydrogenase-like beta-hydroxyacid dehydrogenase
MQIGFIGLGQMGVGMAGRLLKAGHELAVYNRSRGKAESLATQGAKVADEVAAACGGEAVFTMLADDAAIESVAFGPKGIVASLPRGAVHICSSTISIALSERLLDAHSKAGQQFVAAPVFGRPDAAAGGMLFVVASGVAEAIKRVEPLLNVLGQKVFIVSERAPDAHLVKLSGNFLIASVIEGLGEAMALVEKGGVDRSRYLEIMTSSLFGAPIYRTYGNLIAQRKFEPAGFAAPLGQKDIRLVLAAAETLRVPMPVASLMRDRFLQLFARGGEKLDWAAVGALPAADAGLT